ncbi:MAG: DUF4062 domain-containing protein [Lachnospiraceae bacterium]|nr:DUF4062 domain-containing protein [Lachnospiraceae bacterium]
MYSFFVSSTFRDMQGERDAIHRTVLPQLRTLAQEYGQAVQFVDLRWGVSTSELEAGEAQRKVLEVCLHEIDACVPYMIVLLGERYGWAPGSALIDGSAQYTGFTPDGGEISVTELEIQYGIWKNEGKLDRVIFCFREPLDPAQLTEEDKAVYLCDSEDDRRKMERLKGKIRSNPSAQIYEYHLNIDEADHRLTGYDEFAQELAERISAMLKETWGAPRTLSWQEKQKQEDILRCEALQDNFVGLEKTRAAIAQSVRENALTILTGEGGSGKSAMLSILTKDLAQEYRTEIIYCGGSVQCMSSEQLMRVMTYRLTGETAESDQTTEAGSETGSEGLLAARKQWNAVCEAWEDEKVLFLIDAIDQLMPDEGLTQSWFIPAVIPDNIRILCSTTGAAVINRQVLERETDGVRMKSAQLKLEKADEEERRKIIRIHFDREHKQISDKVLEEMIRHPMSGNMLCMDVMVRWLLMLGQSDFAQIAVKEKELGDGGKAIEEYLLEIIGKMPKNPEGLFWDYIYRIGTYLTEDGSERIKKGDFDLLGQSIVPLMFISMTSHGLTRDQLSHVQEHFREIAADNSSMQDHPLYHFWNETTFSRIRLFMGQQLIEREDGRIDISHRLMKQALMDHCVSVNFPSVMIGFINKLPETDETRVEDMIPCALLEVVGSVKEGVPDEGAISDAEICIQNVVSNLGNMADNTEDSERAAAGKKLYERMLQNVLFFLNRREDWSAITDGICDVIELAVKKGERHYYWLITFFSNDLVKHLVQRSEKERNIAIRIEICTVRALFRKGKEDRFAEWTDGEKKRHLLLEQYIMKMLTDLAGMRFSGKLKYGRNRFRFESILNDLDEYRILVRRWFPDSFIVAYRIAVISAYRAMYDAQLSTFSSGRYAAQAEEDAEQMLRVRDDSMSEEVKKFFYANQLTILTRTHLYIARTAVLKGTHHLKEAKRLGEAAAAASESARDNLKHQDVYFCAVLLRGRTLFRLKEHQEAATLLWKTYTQYKESVNMQPAARQYLASIGIELGTILLYGIKPENVTDRGPLLDEIIAREESYYASAPQDNRNYRYQWLELQLFKLIRLPDDRSVEKLAGYQKLLPAYEELKNNVYNGDDYDQMEVDSTIRFIQRLTNDTEKRIAEKRPYYLMKQGVYLQHRNPQEAAALFREAAEAGNGTAQYYLGIALYLMY